MEAARLQEMRLSVRTWNEGRQTPAEWLGQLEAAVHRFCELVGIAVTLRVDDPDWSAYADPTLVAEAVARTAIESLTNAVRHGAATAVRVEVDASPDGLLLKVEDDGKGLGAGPPATPGTGTRSMLDLAARVGGLWAIAPGPDRGAIVTLRIPASTKERIAG